MSSICTSPDDPSARSLIPRRYATPPSLAFPNPRAWFAAQDFTGEFVPLGHPDCNYGRLPVIPPGAMDPDAPAGVLLFVTTRGSPDGQGGVGASNCSLA